jgi:4-hydroxythreonine-4-phosphate dehydrogenase
MAFLAARARRLGLNVNFAQTTVTEAANRFPVALPVSHVEGLVPDKPGDTSPLSGKVVIESITRAVAETMAGNCRALVTAPIHKAALYKAGFKYPGHTEFLAALCSNSEGTPPGVMMLLHEALRVVPLTVHVPLRDVPAMITARLLRDTAQIVEHDLRTRFGIDEPKLAVAGLNPHAGEGGAIGTEDRDIILPTVIDMQHNGMQIEGPFSADTLFFEPNWKKYDAIIAMYHDQALIPIKTLAFDQAVTLTLGLPIVRTSPDHGTAFELAGTGEGSSNSMLAALRLANRLTA